MSVTLISPTAPAVQPASDQQMSALGLFGAQKGYNVNLGGASAMNATTNSGAWIALPFKLNALLVKCVVSALAGTSPTLDFAIQTCWSVTGQTNGIGGSNVDSPQLIVPFISAAAAAAPRLGAPGTVYIWAVVGPYVAFQAVGGGTVTSCAFALTATGTPLGFQFE